MIVKLYSAYIVSRQVFATGSFKKICQGHILPKISYIQPTYWTTANMSPVPEKKL